MTRAVLVRRARAAFDLTQPDMAKFMGFNPRPWQRKEAGESPIRDSEIYALAARCSGIQTIEQAQRIIETCCGEHEANKRRK